MNVPHGTRLPDALRSEKDKVLSLLPEALAKGFISREELENGPLYRALRGEPVVQALLRSTA
jgi:hypothetical protein